MRRFVPRPSPAMIVACVALLVALGGTSVAAVSQLARNSVGTPQIRNNAVTTPKLRNGAVTTPKLRNRSVTLSKLAPNARIPGPAGPAGPAGPPGPPGPPVDLADGAITTAKLAAGAVTTAKIADAAVTAAKIATGAVTASKLSIAVRQSSASVASGATASLSAPCATGEAGVGGGAFFTGAFNATQASNTHIVNSSPMPSGGWTVLAYNGSGSTRTLFVRALCVRAT